MPQLRISAGQFKNTKLNVPDSARPTKERVKLALFSIIADKIENANCLDLYAGSGNLGFEAISRGASSCIFTDNDYFAIKSIKENADKLHAKSQNPLEIEIIRDDSLKYAANSADSFDIIFLDPPYDTTNKHLFKVIDEILSPNGIIVYLSNHTNGISEDLGNLNPDLEVIDSRKYGMTYLDIIAKKP